MARRCGAWLHCDRRTPTTGGRCEIPLRRLGEAEDFGGIAVYLASDASRYMTGQALTVCGGTNMRA